MMSYFFDGLTTPIGRIHIVASDTAILRVYLPNERWEARYVRDSRHPLIARAKKELREYFLGKRTQFTIPLAPNGTPFQKRVWRMLYRIPYGKTLTYAEVAKRVGRRSAVRAVANAIAKNPIPICIPCHRVVRSDAQIGGYSGGISRKQKLITLERTV